jgi:acyl-CoA thioester hydrolase
MLEKLTNNYRVYSEDVDHMGIVYHANHLRFFERARTEYLRSKGHNLGSLALQGTHFAIHHVSLQYHAPGRLDDELFIDTTCELKRAMTLEFKQLMTNQNKTVICEATFQVVCLNDKLKPKRIDKTLFG